MARGALSCKDVLDVSLFITGNDDNPNNSLRYFLRVLEWARKYGLRVCLDLHAVPGSQNGASLTSLHNICPQIKFI